MFLNTRMFLFRQLLPMFPNIPTFRSLSLLRFRNTRMFLFRQQYRKRLNTPMSRWCRLGR
jgi:hypothetical protein